MRSENCPYCGFPCEADFVDVGVGYVQCGPYFCDRCHACQIGPHDKVQDGLPPLGGRNNPNLSPRENETGWYEPGRAYMTSAPTFQGLPVGHKTAKDLYDMGLLDNKED